MATYRISMLHNREIGRELLATDEYEPQDRVIRIGSKAPARQPTK